MDIADAHQDSPDEPKPVWSGAASDSELEWPSSLEPWVAAVGLWTSVSEPPYRLVTRCFGNGVGPEWPFLCSLLLNAGVVERVSEFENFTFGSEWLPALEHALTELGGADAARSKLIEAWLAAPDPDLVSEIAGWASQSR